MQKQEIVEVTKKPNRQWKKKLFEITYGNDMRTQLICPLCGRPLYFSVNKRTGKIEASCEVCSVQEAQR